MPSSRSNKRHYGQNPGLVTAHTSLSQAESDRLEVAAYMGQHPTATIFDVSMECNMGSKMARRYMRLARGGLIG